MMKKIGCVVAIYLGLSSGLLAQEEVKQDLRPPSAEDILETVRNFELIMNKNIPSMDDFDSLYGEGGDNELGADEEYCTRILKLQPDSKECNEAVAKEVNDLHFSSSLYLLDKKLILTGGKNLPVKIFMSPDVKYCDASTQWVTIESLAKIGNDAYKSIELAFPCSQEQRKYWKIELYRINGKLVRKLPFAVTKKVIDYK